MTMILGLVRSDDGPPPDLPDPRGRRDWDVPWPVVFWVVLIVALMAAVPVVTRAFGGLAGYGVVLLIAVLVSLRLEKWCSRQYWRGLHDHQA